MSHQDITRREFIKAAMGSGIVLNLLSCRDKKTVARRKPNIVLIMADDLGFECIGANGGKSYHTPVLDSLAATGVRFEHCYSQPLCTPSRVKLMTGIYNVHNYTKFGALDKSQITFANLLKKEGYSTCVVGKWQLRGGFKGPNHFGFDEYCLWQLKRGRVDSEKRDTRYPNPKLAINGKEINFNNGEYGPDVVSDYACDFIQRNKDKPFLLYYPMILTHSPFDPTPSSSDWNSKSKGSATYKGNVRYFGDMVNYMDKNIGKIITKLEEQGLRNNTLVLFTSDNGTDELVISKLGNQEIAGGKGMMTDAGTHVPLIANWPGVISEGNICRDIVDFTDFLPTICDCANISVPQELKIDGRSFFPQLMGEIGSPREWIYCWFSRKGKVEDAKMFARNKRFKLYHTGELFDIENDVLEKMPLNTEKLGEPELRVIKMLEQVLHQYNKIPLTQ